MVVIDRGLTATRSAGAAPATRDLHAKRPALPVRRSAAPDWLGPPDGCAVRRVGGMRQRAMRTLPADPCTGRGATAHRTEAHAYGRGRLATAPYASGAKGLPFGTQNQEPLVRRSTHAARARCCPSTVKFRCFTALYRGFTVFRVFRLLVTCVALGKPRNRWKANRVTRTDKPRETGIGPLQQKPTRRD